MKYSKSAITVLKAQYRSVLKKCLLINLGLFALGAIAPANAADTWDGAIDGTTDFMDSITGTDWDRSKPITGWGVDQILTIIQGAADKTDTAVALVNDTDKGNAALYNAITTLNGTGDGSVSKTVGDAINDAAANYDAVGSAAAAETAAKGYADSLAANYDAAGSAAAAQAAAKDYTDTATTITAVGTSSANIAVGDSVLTAVGKLDGALKNIEDGNTAQDTGITNLYTALNGGTYNTTDGSVTGATALAATQADGTTAATNVTQAVNAASTMNQVQNGSLNTLAALIDGGSFDATGTYTAGETLTAYDSADTITGVINKLESNKQEGLDITTTSGLQWLDSPTNTQLAVKLADTSMQVTSDGVSVKLADTSTTKSGLQVDANGISVKVGDSLEISNTGFVDIKVNTNQFEVTTGTGLNLADDAVTTSKIENSAVTLNKIASSAIASSITGSDNLATDSAVKTYVDDQIDAAIVDNGDETLTLTGATASVVYTADGVEEYVKENAEDADFTAGGSTALAGQTTITGAINALGDDIDDIIDDMTVASDGTYIDAGTDVGANLSALDVQVKQNADDIAANAIIGTAATSSAGYAEDATVKAAVVAIDGALKTAEDDIDDIQTKITVATAGNYIAANDQVAANLGALDTAIGKVVAGTYNAIDPANTVAANLQALDGAFTSGEIDAVFADTTVDSLKIGTATAITASGTTLNFAKNSLINVQGLTLTDASGNIGVLSADDEGIHTGTNFGVNGNETVSGTLTVTGMTNANGGVTTDNLILNNKSLTDVDEGTSAITSGLATTVASTATVLKSAENAEYNNAVTSGSNITGTTLKTALQNLDVEIGADTEYVSANNGVAGGNSVKANINAVNAKLGNVADTTVNGYDATTTTSTLVGAVSQLNTNMGNVLGGIYKAADGSYDKDAIKGTNGFDNKDASNNLTNALKSYADNVKAAMGTTYAADGTFTNNYSKPGSVNYDGLTTTDDLVTAISQLDKNIGTSAELATTGINGVDAAQTVNQNINAVNAIIGDLTKVEKDNYNLTDDAQTMPTTVVEALNNIDARLGKVHGLAQDLGDSYNGNLYDGTTVAQHLTAIDASIGNRTTTYTNTNGSNGYVATAGADVATISAEIASNIGTAADLGAEINGVSAQNTVNQNIASVNSALGNVQELVGTHYAYDSTNLTDAVKAVDAGLYALDNDVRALRHHFEAGMASAAALSALQPNARASGNTQLAIGTGAYRGHNAYAIGGFHWINDNWLLNAGVAYDNAEATYRMGITYSW